MTARVELTDEAQADAFRIDQWWRSNRPKSPCLFEDELVRAIELLETAPEIGVPYIGGSGRKVRRYLLHRTGHQIYYRYSDEMATVTILTVWSSRSDEPPPL